MVLVTKLTVVSTRSPVVEQANDSLTKWINMAPIDHWHATPVPSLSPPIVCGGEDQGGMPTSVIKIYKIPANHGKSLHNYVISSTKSLAAVAASIVMPL